MGGKYYSAYSRSRTGWRGLRRLCGLVDLSDSGQGYADGSVNAVMNYRAAMIKGIFFFICWGTISLSRRTLLRAAGYLFLIFTVVNVFLQKILSRPFQLSCGAPKFHTVAIFVNVGLQRIFAHIHTCVCVCVCVCVFVCVCVCVCVFAKVCVFIVHLGAWIMWSE
jgi:hypothetical protein